MFPFWQTNFHSSDIIHISIQISISFPLSTSWVIIGGSFEVYVTCLTVAQSQSLMLHYPSPDQPPSLMITYYKNNFCCEFRYYIPRKGTSLLINSFRFMDLVRVLSFLDLSGNICFYTWLYHATNLLLGVLAVLNTLSYYLPFSSVLTSFKSALFTS